MIIIISIPFLMKVPYGVFSCDFPLFKLPPEGMGVIPIGSDDLSVRYLSNGSFILLLFICLHYYLLLFIIFII
jgi:hypothetical protein